MMNEQFAFLQSAEMIGLSASEVKEYKQKWFERVIPEDKRQEALDIYCLDKHGYLWHAFSGKLLEHLEGDEANAAFDSTLKQEAVLIANWDDAVSCKVKNAASITSENLDTIIDVILTDSNFEWTYVKTHEQECGPYFHKIRKEK